MASPVAPPKSTGGGGIVFEDKVCAWFLAHMLVDEPPLEPELGSLERIHLQTRPDGWFFDDVLLTVREGASVHRCALSIKSNAQFTNSAAPRDFVAIAWEQFLKEGSTVFSGSDDLMGLVTAPLAAPVREALDALVKKTVRGDPQLLSSRYAERGWANKVERALFESFACPPRLAAAHGVSASDTAKLISKLRFLEFDFQALTSRDEARAIALCKRALRTGEPTDAAQLWEHLLRWAAELKPSAGFATKESLIRRLRPVFSLAAFPNHKSDWGQLTRISAATVGQVSDVIGGRVRLERQEDLTRITSSAAPGSGVVLTGASGCGKSALAKRWVEQLGASGEQCLWFDGQSFERPDYAAFVSDLGLAHSLDELARLIPDTSAMLVLDGLDRLYDVRSFGLVGALMRAMGANEPGSSWRVLITTQIDESARVEECLLRAGIDVRSWPHVELRALEISALEPVWAAIPQTARLKHEQELAPILLNLKVLDLIATRLVAGADVPTGNWVGESSVAAWFWEAVVTQGEMAHPRARFLMRLAELQGDEVRAGTRTDVFEIPDLVPLETLRRDRICGVTRDEHVRFEHDLFGDWARLRLLVANANRLPEYLRGRVDSPLWHRAFRLFGIHLLEHVQDHEAWRRTLESFSEAPLVQDLLVESAVYAANPLPLLERMHPELTASDGNLLRRLLGRFLAFATRPDPTATAFAMREGDPLPQIAARFRYPKWQYWPAVVQFLHRHREKFVALAPAEIARVSELWLRHTPHATRYRLEAAELGLMTGQLVLADDRIPGTGYEERKACFESALASAAELPDLVAEFCLRAVQRISSETPEGSNADAPIVRSSVGFGRRRPEKKPCPEGPLRKVPRAFREVALAPSGLLPLFTARPAAAREVALAALIEEPKPEEWGGESDWSRMHLGLQDYELRWHPPVFLDGPFLAFLMANFNEGFELIARLVDFATERWCASARGGAHGQTLERTGDRVLNDGHEFADELTIAVPLDPTVRYFIGAARVFGWSSGVGMAPKPVAAALMALEQYFYSKQDQNQPVEKELAAVLGRVRSVAFLKVLCEVGKRDPKLFVGPLKALLATPEVYRWDIQVSVHGRSALGIGLPLRGAFLAGIAQKFHSMDHRDQDLRSVAMSLVLTNAGMREYFSAVRRAWAARAEADAEMGEFIQQLDNIVGFENYERRHDSEHGEVIVNVRELARHATLAEKMKEEKEAWQITTMPMSCRSMIDKGTGVQSEQLESFWQTLERVAEKRAAEAQNTPLAAGVHASGVRAAIGALWTRISGAWDVIRGRAGSTQSERETPEASAPEPDRPSDHESLPDRNANALAGMIAVLVRFNGDWLREHPTRKQWCIEQLELLICSPPALQPWDVATSVSDWTWDCFAAEAVSSLWSEEPGDPGRRALVARAVLVPRYSAVSVLFRRCFEDRGKLGADFNRLRRLLFEWASVRDMLDFIGTGERVPGRASERQIARARREANKWAKRVVQQFVSGQLPTEVSPWSNMDVAARMTPVTQARYRAWYDLGLDIKLLRVAHEWLPGLDVARDERERAEWIEFHREALRFVLAHAIRDAAQEGHCYPTEDEAWVVDRVAARIHEMKPSERPVDLWQPIFALPESAHAWPELFLKSFHQTALARQPTPPSYASNTRAMVSEVLARADANVKSLKWPYYEDIWAALVGIDWLTRRSWAPRHRELVADLADVYEKWASLKFTVREQAPELALWLESEAAQPLRLKALVWLEQDLRSQKGKWLARRDDTDNAIASLLHTTWQHDEAFLRMTPASFTAFKALLGALVEEQNALALDLNGKLGKLV